MNIRFFLLCFFIFDFTLSKIHLTKHLTTLLSKSARKDCYVDVPAILKAVQRLGEVTHHDVVNFDKISGGNVSIVLPRDPATMIVNQLPIRGFRLKDIDHEDLSEQSPNALNIYDRFLQQVDNNPQMSINKYQII